MLKNTLLSPDHLARQLTEQQLYSKVTGTDHPDIVEEKKKILADLVFALGYAEYKVVYLGLKSRDAVANPSPNTIYIENTNYNDVQRFSVKKEYEDEFSSADATAEDLGLDRLPNTQEECEKNEIFNNILAFTAKKNITNTGFHSLDAGNVFDLNDSMLILWRSAYTLLFLALVTEFSFGATQFYFGGDGLNSLLTWIKNNLAIALISYPVTSAGSLLDLFVNLLLISIRNDTNDTLFVDMGSKLMNALVTISALLSIPASIAGGTGNIVGLLPWILPEKDCSDLDTCSSRRKFAEGLAIFTITVACMYYHVVLLPSRKGTFELYSNLSFIWPNSNNFWRWSQILIEFSSNDAFRATLLAATTIKTARYFFSLSDETEQTLSIAVFAAVTFDILTARIKGTVKHWSDPDFIYVKKKEASDVLTTLPSSKIYLFEETAMGITMALGAGLFVSDPHIIRDPMIAVIASPLLALSILSINLMAQRSLAAHKAVLENMLPAELIKRKEALVKRKKDDHIDAEVHAPLLDDIEQGVPNGDINCEKNLQSLKTENQIRDERISMTKKHYNALKQSFSDLVPTKQYKFFVGGSLLIRGLGEITATDVLSTVWALDLILRGSYGAVLFLIPPTIRNLGQMFFPGLCDNNQKRTAEEYVGYCKETENVEVNKRPDFEKWLQTKRGCCHFVDLYLRSGYDRYTIAEVENATKRRIEELQRPK